MSNEKNVKVNIGNEIKVEQEYAKGTDFKMFKAVHVPLVIEVHDDLNNYQAFGIVKGLLDEFSEFLDMKASVNEKIEKMKSDTGMNPLNMALNDLFDSIKDEDIPKDFKDLFGDL